MKFVIKLSFHNVINSTVNYNNLADLKTSLKWRIKRPSGILDS